MSGSEDGQARRNIVTVLVDGEQVELAEVEIEENAEVTVEEEMAVKDDVEDEMAGEVIMVDTIQQEVITTEQAQNAELELEYAAKEATPGKRLLLKDWLVQKLDSEEMPDILSWYNKSEGLFKIRWLHKATDSWEIAADGVLFRQWCIHTGKYDPANENPRKWKANFRCALNSLPDVIIVPSLCVRKGKEAYRVFKILAEKIPEKVREKQESSRKRRREKRESLLKAFAQNQAAMGNVEQAEALNAQIASNPSNIKIQLKRGSISAGGKKLKIVNVITEDGVRISKSDTPTSTATTSGGKTLLNGMDALCTAAAMMADTPGGEEGDEEEYDSSVLETITIETESDSPSTPSKPTTVTATLNRKSGVNEGDVVTYYRPVGPIQVVNRDKQQAANATLLPPNVGSTLKSGIHTVTQLPTVIPGVTGLPVFRPINPVGMVQLAASNNVINTSSGNVVFSVRLAPGSMAADPRSTKINVIQDQTHQNVTMQQLANLQPVNIQQLNTSSTSGLTSQTSAYLIPKNLIQQQIAASAGNQPARVYTVKQNKNLSEMIVSSSAQLLDLQRSLQQTKPATSVATIVDTPQTSSGASTDVRSAPALLDQLEYLNFKESVSALDFNKSQFQLSKHSDLIRVIRLYDSDKPSVEMSVSINRDYTFNVVIHNRNMSPNHELLKRHRKTIKNIQQFAQLLHRLSEYVTCIGNPEDMAHRQYTDYSSFISAFQEPDFGAKNSLLRYHSTIRSNTCHMLIKNPGDMDLPEADAKNLFRCEECKRIRTQVMSMRGLFSLIDGPKIPDNEQSRKKRLQLLKDFTTKEVLANRVDLLETQIKRYQKLLPSELPAVEEVTTDGTQSVTVTLTPSDTATVECTDQNIDNHNTDTTSELIASISDECTEGDVQNVIRVAFSDQADSGEPLTSRLTDDAGAVYHIVDDGSNQDGVKLHTFTTESADAGTDIILVSTSGDGNLQSADGYLTQLTDSALGDNT